MQGRCHGNIHVTSFVCPLTFATVLFLMHTFLSTINQWQIASWTLNIHSNNICFTGKPVLLRTGGSVKAKFYCIYELANKHLVISDRKKNLQFSSMVLFTPSSYCSDAVTIPLNHVCTWTHSDIQESVCYLCLKSLTCSTRWWIKCRLDVKEIMNGQLMCWWQQINFTSEWSTIDFVNLSPNLLTAVGTWNTKPCDH